MKHRKWWYSIGLVAIILLVAGIVASQQATASPRGAIRPYQPPIITQDHVPTYPIGGKAIPVNISSGASTNTTNTSSTPAFTKSDVEAFLNKNGFYAGPLVPGAHLKILTIQFVTAKQASTLMSGETVGRPDNYLVCYVKVQGPFQLTQVHAGPHIPGMKARSTAQIGDVVFDGHSGNVLVWGVY